LIGYYGNLLYQTRTNELWRRLRGFVGGDQERN
jgi:hypothetical protein